MSDDTQNGIWEKNLAIATEMRFKLGEHLPKIYDFYNNVMKVDDLIDDGIIDEFAPLTRKTHRAFMLTYMYAKEAMHRLKLAIRADKEDDIYEDNYFKTTEHLVCLANQLFLSIRDQVKGNLHPGNICKTADIKELKKACEVLEAHISDEAMEKAKADMAKGISLDPWDQPDIVKEANRIAENAEEEPLPGSPEFMKRQDERDAKHVKGADLRIVEAQNSQLLTEEAKKGMLAP